MQGGENVIGMIVVLLLKYIRGMGVCMDPVGAAIVSREV
jgi:hypothetical protein